MKRITKTKIESIIDIIETDIRDESVLDIEDALCFMYELIGIDYYDTKSYNDYRNNRNLPI